METKSIKTPISPSARALSMGIQKVIEHSFNDLEPSTVTSILKELAKKNMLDELLECYEYIDINAHVIVLGEERPISKQNSLSFHEWLLTNPDERAFKLWLKVRKSYKDKGSYHIHDWEGSAALIIYSNLPERLDCLDVEEWDGEIDSSKLSKLGVSFKFGDNISDSTKRNIQKDINQSPVTAVEVAALQGSLGLVELSIINIKKLINRKHHYRREEVLYSRCDMYPIYYIMNGEDVEIKPLLEAMKKDFDGLEHLSYKMISLFKEAIVYASIEQLKAIWSEVSNKDKEKFFTATSMNSGGSYVIGLQQVLNKGLIDIAEYMYSLGIEYGKWKPLRLHNYLLDCVKDGKLKSVEFIIKKSPELMEEKSVVYKDGVNDRVGTVLELAVIKGKKEIADLLLLYGANTKPLESLICFQPFVKKGDQDAISIAERALLLGKIKHQIISSQPTTIVL